MGLEYSLVEFESWTPRPQWLGGVKRLRIGQPQWRHVDRAVIEQLVGSLIDKGGVGRSVILLLVIILGLAACGPEVPEASPPATIASTTPTQTHPSPRSSPTPVPSPSVSSEPARTAAHVVEVVDGDTIRVAINGREVQTVRIIGVDTPETKDPRKPVMYFGMEATAKTQELVDRAGGHVLLEKDVNETDKYGRLLRYVWLLQPMASGCSMRSLSRAGTRR